MQTDLKRVAGYKGLRFLLVLAVLAVGLVVLPRGIAAWLLVGALLVGAYQAVRSVSQWVHTHIHLSALQQQRLARLAASIAVGLALLAAVYFRPESPSDQADRGLYLWVLVSVVLAVTLRFWPGNLPVYFQWRDVRPYDSTAGKVRWWLVALSLIALGLLTEANAHLFRTELTLSTHLQFGLLLTGCVTLALGLGSRLPPVKAAGGSPSIRWALVGLTLTAFALNTTGIEDYVHIWIDEFHFTDMILRMWANPDYPLLALNSGVAAFTSVFAYLQNLSIGIFGAELTALRLVSAGFGAAAIPAMYLLGRELFDRKTALLAALLLVTFPPHIHFSRLGINNSADPVFGMLALTFVVRALKHGRRGDYALAGVMLGLTQYFYEGGRLLYPALLLGWLGCISLGWRPRTHWRGLVVLLFTALLVALPLYITIHATQSALAPRLTSLGVLDGYWKLLTDVGLGPFLRHHYRAPLMHFVHLPDTSQFFYGGDTALILGHLIPFFMIGVVLAVLRLRLVGVLLVTWLVGTIIGNSLIGQWIYTARYVVTFPAVILLIAVGLRHVLIFLNPWPQVAALAGGWRRRSLVWIGAVLCLLLTVPQVFYYFGPHLAVYNRQVRPYHDHIDMMYRTRSFPLDTRVIIVKTPANDVFVDHFRVLEAFWQLPSRLQLLDSGPETSATIGSLSRETDIALFIEAEDYETLYAIYSNYGSQTPQYSPYNVPLENQFLLFYLIAPGNTAYQPPARSRESRAG